jgi:two-component system response regulator VicR
MDEHILKHEDVEINLKRYEVKKNGKFVDMAYAEFSVLVMLIENKDKVVSRKEILTKIWDIDDNSSMRIVDVVISRLRKKGFENLIKTRRKVGYYV